MSAADEQPDEAARGPGSPVSAATVIGEVVRGRGLRLLALDASRGRVALGEPARADADHRVVLDELEAVRDERGAAAGRVREPRLAEQPVAEPAARRA